MGEMVTPYRPMLPSPTAAPPAGDGWVRECKVYGYRCVARVSRSGVRLWSRGGGEWVGRLASFHTGQTGRAFVDRGWRTGRVASLARPEEQRAALVDLLQRYGRRHPHRDPHDPDDCIQAVVRYTARTPTR
jgi:ATP-dependent DNA ligase